MKTLSGRHLLLFIVLLGLVPPPVQAQNCQPPALPVPISGQNIFTEEQENDLGDGLARIWPEPDLGIQMHYGYAFQWFAMSAAILIYYLVTHVTLNRTRQPE